MTLGIVGDSAAGKTTLTRGIVNVFGAERVTAVCVDDYHRYVREQRKELTITPLNPECNYIGIMEQHLRLLATGEPILKPVYGHSHGTLEVLELIKPRDIVIIEGLLPYHTKAMRHCFDVKVFLDPPEDLRQGPPLCDRLSEAAKPSHVGRSEAEHLRSHRQVRSN